MNLHEYQAKQLMVEFGVPIPRGRAVSSVEEAIAAANELGGSRWVVKAQVHAGGRGKAGGVKLVDGLASLQQAAESMLGQRMVTGQSDPQGLPINKVLVEEISDIQQELYLGVLVDRSTRRVTFMASAAGGMDIEQVAAETPEKIVTVAIDPAAGIQAYQIRKIGFGLGLDKEAQKDLYRVMTGLNRLFDDLDASLVEINPLVLTGDNHLVALDGKINLDDNALYRQPALVELRDVSQENEKEHEAHQYDLNYIALDGNIGCMVNGAGLAMATMDLIQLKGGMPANFLDVGGGTTAERVSKAFNIILSDDKVKAILVNIFGGIVRCDLIAEGIIQVVKESDIQVPVVVRLEGTNVETGRQLLDDSGLSIITANSLNDAAEQVVAVAGGKQ
ncbi:MAG: ADP-forming succinate--CoA ligase subunit beta [Gammaproteobacteria bacterium]|nr:ADP-forming succinate--CoA ligase subunit beta [Gammaproteobacteria bacterium]